VNRSRTAQAPSPQARHDPQQESPRARTHATRWNLLSGPSSAGAAVDLARSPPPWCSRSGLALVFALVKVGHALPALASSTVPGLGGVERRLCGLRGGSRRCRCGAWCSIVVLSPLPRRPRRRQAQARKGVPALPEPEGMEEMLEPPKNAPASGVRRLNLTRDFLGLRGFTVQSPRKLSLAGGAGPSCSRIPPLPDYRHRSPAAGTLDS